MLRWLWLSAAVIGLDLGTKRLAETALSPYEPLKLTSFFDLTLMYNTGAASITSSGTGRRSISPIRPSPSAWS